MSKLILFYKYVDIQYPEQIRKWQHKLCLSFGIKGRIIFAHEGINGTLGGSDESIKSYIEAMNAHHLFKDIDFKESEGGAECFPRLRTMIRAEIVRLGVDPKVITATDGGKHLTPQETHTLLQNKPQDLVIVDGRNWYESQVGHFEEAITPNTKTFREFPAYIDQNLEQFKDKQVLMYCTGGIRCERATAYLKSKNVTKEVYQIQGGIHRYIEQFPDGYFRGKNYVFDGRVTVQVNNDVLSQCYTCKITCDEYTNCINASCNRQYVSCAPCLEQLANACSTICNELVINKKVPIRTKPVKISIQKETSVRNK